MSNPMKKAIQGTLVAARHKEYDRQIRLQSITGAEYLADRRKAWREENEAAVSENTACAVLSYGDAAFRSTSSAVEALKTRILGMKEEYVIFAEDPARLHQGASDDIRLFLTVHPDTKLLYADETNWLKPDWSPDTLLSFFYFGHLFVMKKDLILQVLEKIKERKGSYSTAELKGNRLIYALGLLGADLAGGAAHIPVVLYEGEDAGDPEAGQVLPDRPLTFEERRRPIEPRDGEGHFFGFEPEYDDLKKGLSYSDADVSEQKAKVSIIILSKDHPKLLATCIHSIFDFTTYENLELIVVDNGSNEENQALIRRLQKRMDPKFIYHYAPQPFNFSRLCNLGASLATGEYLLFLNDDTEVVDYDWLTRMMEKAAKPYVGAVGIKLLYSGGEFFQHVGITNLHLGPAHKLTRGTDLISHYYGITRMAVNMAGVTGACLLMRREVFEQTGGWNEDLQVAYNDVELCYHLLALGYKNVCCNNTKMIHHESISRGLDAGIEKLHRLHQERDTLYGLHPGMWNHDPYYNPAFLMDQLEQEYVLGYYYDEKRVSETAHPVACDGFVQREWHNDVLRSGIEFAGDRGLWEHGKSDGGDLYIQGWFYALQVDNSRYDISLLLKPLDENKPLQSVDGPMWKVPFHRVFRPGTLKSLAHIDHPALSGCSVWIPKEELPEGEYLIGYLWEDACSRQKLYEFTAETVVVSAHE